MKTNPKVSQTVRTVLGFVWLSALAAALVFSAIATDRKARQVEEYPCCCDPFGYLQMAQDARNAAAEGRPRFVIETVHTRLLIDLMKAKQVPLPLWEDAVAPLAYHYFPQADHVAVQYPPGAGLMLALFPQGKALHSLDRVVILAFLLIGLSMLVAAAISRAWLSGGLLLFALNFGFEVLAQIDNASFSINGMFVPLLLSAVCLFGAFSCGTGGRNRLQWALIFLGGLMFGFAVLVRLPVALLLPGVLVLLWPSRAQPWYRSALIAFLAGFAAGGFLPLAIHQSRVAGSWLTATYPRADTIPPALAYVWQNFSFYFGPGKSSTYNWILPVAFAGCLGLFLWARQTRPENGSTNAFLAPVGPARLGLAAFVMFGVSTLFVLTHKAVVHYYPVPAMFGALLVLAFGAYGIERRSRNASPNELLLRRRLRAAAFVLAMIPGLVAIERVWSHYEPDSSERLPPPFTMPAELADEDAWVWADNLSGTLWYYARKPAHKLSGTNKETRLLVYDFVRKRGELQYLIGEDPAMKPVESEIVELGGVLELRGEVEGRSYYLIHWPANTLPVASLQHPPSLND